MTYAAEGVSSGKRVPGWSAAHRSALLRGEFEDPCVHGLSMPLCSDRECRTLYDQIIVAYLGGER